VTGKVRRSTRIDKTIPLIVLGLNQRGESFMERTLSISLNMHGCRYSSRHDHVVGTEVTLQVVGLNIPDEKPTTVRAVVRSIHPPASLRELHQIGVELETPANVWGIVPTPADWTCAEESNTPTAQPATVVGPMHDSVTKKAGPGEATMMKPQPTVSAVARSSSPPADTLQSPDAKGLEAPRPQRIVVSSERLISALQGRLQQEAEKAVQAAATHQLNDLMGKALNSIEEARRSSVQEVQELSAKQMEKMRVSSKEESGRELAVQWKADMEAHRGRVEQISQRLEKQAGKLSRELATAAQEYAEKTALKITPQILGRLKEAVSQATSDLDHSAALVVDRRYERLVESVQTVTQEALSELSTRSAEAQALAQTAVKSAVEEFRRETELHANAALAEAKERAVSVFSSLDAESRSSCDMRRQALETEVARSAERAMEQFRAGMKEFMYSCLVATVGAGDEHFKAKLDALLKDEGEALDKPRSKSPTHDEE
jgi:hypothetical protein